MNWKRILMGKCSVHYRRLNNPLAINRARYWSGQLIDFNISKISFCLDCRVNWVKDMVEGGKK
jgi:hypothetical protein